MVVIFNLQNSHLWTLSLPREEFFQVNDQNRPETNLSVVEFHSQPREMLTPKPLNASLSVFTLESRWFVAMRFPPIASLSSRDPTGLCCFRVRWLSSGGDIEIRFSAIQ